MKYLIAVFGVTLAFVFATAIADNPTPVRKAHLVSDWSDVGSRVISLQGEQKPVPVRRAEYR